MPFDAFFLTAVRRELEGSLTGCRIDKVQQPQRDTLILSMRGAAGGGRLLLTASPNHPRIHLTNEPAENPAQPPMFCMLLRKHLTGGRLVSMQQPEMERLLDLTFDCTDEMGSPTRKHLILEIMGRNSNLILTGEDGRILDCLRRVDFEMSEKRQVLPGLYYHLPPTQGKRDPFAVTGEELAALLSAQTAPKRLDGWLLDTFGGLSPLVCRELAFRLTGDLDTDLSALSAEEKTALAARLLAAFAQLQTMPPQPMLLYRDERPWDFTCLPVTQYGDFIRQEPYDSFSQLLDRFYAARDRAGDLGIVVVDGGGADDKIGIAEIVRRVTDGHGNAQRAQVLHGGGVVHVAALHGESHGMQDLGERAHRHAADAGEVRPLAGYEIGIDIHSVFLPKSTHSDSLRHLPKSARK